jgi:hypothetical protein
MCPNRFMPLFKMALIYDATGQNEKLKEIAAKIVQKEAKIPSVTISRIKAKIEEMVNLI